MKILGLTGGIASGKSSAIRLICELLPEVVIFDSDATVHRLFSDNASVRDGLADIFGADVMLLDGQPNRQMMRQAAFANPELKKQLEALVHPRVRESCLNEKEVALRDQKALFIADVPLLFENKFDFGQQMNILVAVSRASQCSRLISRSPMELADAASIIDSQLPLSQKLKQADVVWWNEGPLPLLRSQVSRFLTYFLR